MNSLYIQQLALLAEIAQRKPPSYQNIPEAWFVKQPKETTLTCGVIIMAGGESTRFGSLKSLHPVSTSQKCTLELLIERSLSKGKVAVMGSPKTRALLAPYVEHVDYFEQKEEWPFLYEGKGWIPEKEGFKQGPVGNGVVLEEFVRSGLAEQWKKHGVDYVEVMCSDNPMLYPHDKELASGIASGCDVAVKVVKKKDPLEKLGLVGMANGKLHVWEYVERAGEGWGYAGWCAIPLEKVIEWSKEPLPWHVTTKQTDTPFYRFEKWIIDHFSKAIKPCVSVLERGFFHPLKTKNDIATTMHALAQQDGVKNYSCTGGVQ